jgi:hypothetical protein
LQGAQGRSAFDVFDDVSSDVIFYPSILPITNASISTVTTSSEKLVFNPSSGSIGIGTSVITNTLTVVGTATATNYYGNGETLVGIVTQIVPGIGIDIFESQIPGKGKVEIQAYKPIGRTIYVSMTGDDNNTGLAENYPKRTIKAAASVAVFGDTIKIFPGTYVEDNPIVLAKTVSVEGTELRNCVITPRNRNQDMFYVNNGCHITDASFIGPSMTNGAAVVALQPLLGVATDRFFDASRMIRFNLRYIAKESVGFLTSGFSGFAGGHREQDAAKLIDSNLNYISAEAVGFLTSSSGYNFTLNNSDYTNCREDVVSIMNAISYDLKANSNRKSIGAGYSYFNNSGGLIHITGIGVSQATIAALDYAAGIATHVINNLTPPISYQGVGNSVSQVKNLSVIQVEGGCVGVGTTIRQLVGIVTNMIGAGTTLNAPPVRYGVTLESQDCADDVVDIWKCIIHDITRGGNSRSVAAGKAYYNDDWSLKTGILKNPEEVKQTISTIDYSFNIARAVINNVTWGGYPVGLGTTVVNAFYDNNTGITTITAINHGLIRNDSVKIIGLEFSCPSGPTSLIYPTGSLGYIFNVNKVVGVNTFEVVVGQSTLPHTYVSGGTIQKYTNYQNEFTQIKDLSMQIDPDTGFNNAINGCANVVSALKSCVGVVTSIVGLGSTAFSTVGFNTTYPGNRGRGFETIAGITSALYEESSGKTTVKAPGLSVKVGDLIEIRDLTFSCSSGGPVSTQKFPSGYYGYEFYVSKINSDSSFDIYTGISTIPHDYVSGGYIINRSIGITSALYDNLTGITTITAPGISVKTGDIVTLRDLEFSCSSGAATTTIYPTGNNGYTFEVLSVPGVGNTFTVNVGKSTIPHNYVSGGVVFPPYSKGVGPITQGPYVRNCTNFIGDSIGMKVDGFAAEPGDQEDIGVTGTMSVDSYTQYNQGGIGVSITNGAYTQLVSIFTICDDIGIFTKSGGQCDITNSNCSFGNYGLVSDGVGDYTSKSIYRYTGETVGTAEIETDTVTISGLGTQRPYDGQAIYFGELYYQVNSINVTNGGSGYNPANPPNVIIEFPEGPSGIRAEGSANVDQNGTITSIDVIANGSQYLDPPSITITDIPGGSGVNATAEAVLYPLYYTITTATLPVSGISTVVLTQNLNNTVGAGTTVYFSRLSLQIATSISLEWVGSGTNINTAKPALGGVTIQENEVDKRNGGQVVYTSTNQAGNFQIGDGVVINQLTGTITGRAFSQSLLNTVTPLIIALS